MWEETTQVPISPMSNFMKHIWKIYQDSTPAQCVETQQSNYLWALACNSTIPILGRFSPFSYLLWGFCCCLLAFLHFGSCYQYTRPESSLSITYFWTWGALRTHSFVCLWSVLMPFCPVQPLSFHVVWLIGLVFFLFLECHVPPPCSNVERVY